MFTAMRTRRLVVDDSQTRRVTNKWVLGARPRTLPAAVAPVLVGTAAAMGDDGELVWWRAVAAAVVALALQVATNFVNDYADGERGTDSNRVGPVRLVGSGLASASAVKKAALVAFAVAGVVGGALALAVGPELFVVGALAMVAGWAYTGGPKPYGYLGLGEVFVFVFFGLVATVGSTYVHTQSVSALSVVLGCTMGCLACALLVVNNLRDIPTDTVSGKKTLAVRLGDHRTRRLYVGLVVVGHLLLGVAAIWAWGAPSGLIGLALALPALGVVMRGAKGPALIEVLGATAQVQLVTGVLTTIGVALTA
jgi:1,4-dihydroxy-2-naphthoate polyprenyltransferase